MLLIVCVNLANLAIARGAARSHDLAIRRSLGASRASLVRGVLAESLLPAWRAATMDPQQALRDGGRGPTGGAGGRLIRQGLVAIESALGAALLVLAGLLIGSFFNLLSVDKGFDASRVVTAPLRLPEGPYSTPERREALYRRLVERLREMPGVKTAAVVSRLPLDGEDWVDMVRKQGDTRTAAEMPPVNFRFCSPDYFEAMDIPVVAGRVFGEGDREKNLAVISEAAARRSGPVRTRLARSSTGATRGRRCSRWRASCATSAWRCTASRWSPSTCPTGGAAGRR